MKDSETAIRQAELILKLFELRRETVMRSARSYVGGEFMPSSADEVMSLVSAGGPKASYILQVYGYWDMVSAFVVHGALDKSLVHDTCPEMYFQYAKIQPYLAGIREKMHLPELFRSIESVVEGCDEDRCRLVDMRNNLGEIAKSRESGI